MSRSEVTRKVEVRATCLCEVLIWSGSNFVRLLQAWTSWNNNSFLQLFGMYSWELQFLMCFLAKEWFFKLCTTVEPSTFIPVLVTSRIQQHRKYKTVSYVYLTVFNPLEFKLLWMLSEIFKLCNDFYQALQIHIIFGGGVGVGWGTVFKLTRYIFIKTKNVSSYSIYLSECLLFSGSSSICFSPLLPVCSSLKLHVHVLGWGESTVIIYQNK